MDSSKSMVKLSDLLYQFKKNNQEHFMSGQLLVPSEKSTIESYM